MAVKFGKDGTLYCNTVRYNYKQARNMIADNSYGNISGTDVWSMYNVSASTSPVGYKSYRCFYFNASSSQAASLQQKIPTLYTNHKYYISARAYSADLQANGAIYLQDSSNSSIGAISLGQFYSAWTLVSNIITPTYNVTAGRLYIIEYSRPVYLSRFILIDLTDTFGSGNEPTKEWCDNNIREQEVFVNYGNVSNNITNANIASRYTGSNMDKYDYGYLQLDSNWEPRDYMLGLFPYSSASEAYLYSASSFTLNTSYTYYFQIEMHGYISGASYDLYFPIAEPLLGQVPMVTNEGFNGGGGMSGWKRVSMFGSRSTFAAGSYQLRFDINNRNTSSWQRATGLVLVYIQSLVTQYNNNNGTSITVNDVNKEWCDRWIDGRSSPIIHIKDPNNTQIKFNTSYDVVCNDIEIRPEMNKITFDKTGTIKCKKLVRTQVY
jgi:hypothetical protein